MCTGQAYRFNCTHPGRLPHPILGLHVQQCGCYHLRFQLRIKGERGKLDTEWKGVGTIVKKIKSLGPEFASPSSA